MVLWWATIRLISVVFPFLACLLWSLFIMKFICNVYIYNVGFVYLHTMVVSYFLSPGRKHHTTIILQILLRIKVFGGKNMMIDLQKVLSISLFLWSLSRTICKFNTFFEYHRKLGWKKNWKYWKMLKKKNKNWLCLSVATLFRSVARFARVRIEVSSRNRFALNGIQRHFFRGFYPCHKRVQKRFFCLGFYLDTIRRPHLLKADEFRCHFRHNWGLIVWPPIPLCTIKCAVMFEGFQGGLVCPPWCREPLGRLYGWIVSEKFHEEEKPLNGSRKKERRKFPFLFLWI